MNCFKWLWHEPSNTMAIADCRGGALPLITICQDDVSMRLRKELGLMNESNGKTTREWIKECESLRAKLDIAVKALEAIATVTTVGYTEARKARKLAQETLVQISERLSDEKM